MTETLIAQPGQAPVILRREALAAGYSEAAIVKLCRDGHWVRLRHGAYTDRATWQSCDEAGRYALTTRAVLKQAKTRLVVSHATAAVSHYGAAPWGVDLGTVHVTRTDLRAGRVEAGVHQHQGVLLPEDLSVHGEVEVTSATRTALDATTHLATEAALAIVNHLLHEGHTTAAELRARYEPMASHPGTLRTDLVIRLADPRVSNLAESRTWFWCWRGGLPRPEPQHEVFVDGMGTFYLDFAWPALGKWLEFDGNVKYTKLLKPGQSVSDAVLAEKAREDGIRATTGWKCLRITWADLQDPVRLVAKIRRFLERR